MKIFRLSTVFTILVFFTMTALAHETTSLYPIRGIQIPNSSGISSLVKTEEGIYFSSDSSLSDGGVDILNAWRLNLDGTDAKIIHSINITTSSLSSTVKSQSFIKLGNKVIFDLGSGIWSYDLLSQSTLLLKQFTLPGTDDKLGGFLDMQGTIYFWKAQDGNTELWKTSGAQDNTIRIKSLPSTANAAIGIDYIIGYKNKLYFSYDDGIHGNEMWISDGTSAGTKLFIDFLPGTLGDLPALPAGYIIYKDLLYFTTGGGWRAGSELWKSDGSIAGTTPVFQPDGASIQEFLISGEDLYFSTKSDFSLSEIWKSDGTSSGSIRLKQLYPTSGNASRDYMSQAVTYDGKIYFGVNSITDYTLSSEYTNTDIWESDGSSMGTKVVDTLGLPVDGYSRYGMGLIANMQGFFYSDQLCTGTMMMLSCITSIRLKTREASGSSTIAIFNPSEYVFLENSVTTEEEFFFPTLMEDGLAKLYSTIAQKKVDNISPIINYILDNTNRSKLD